MAEVQRLVESGVDVNRSDYDKRTALHIACSDVQVKCARLLVDSGANVVAADRWGNTPMSEALKSGDAELKLLLDDALLLQNSTPRA